MIAYYEGETEYSPSNLLPQLAQAPGVTIDELLGTEPVRKRARPVNSRLQSTLQQIEKLDSVERRQVLQLIDAFIECRQFKRGMTERRTS